MSEDVCRIDFEPIGKRVDVPESTSLFEAARQAGIGLTTVCGGEGTCGRCRVVVMSGEVSPPAEAEHRFLSQLELNAGQRLACRAQALTNVKVHVPKASVATDQRLQLSGDERSVPVDAAVHAYEVDVEPPTLRDLSSDLERLTNGLETAHGLRHLTAMPEVIRVLSPLARRTGWRLTAYVHRHEIVGLEGPGRGPVGFACDLGTTKLAGYLIDLETGQQLAATGLTNPQISYGEDVISRLAYAARNENGGRELARVVREALNTMIGTLVEEAGVSRHQVAEACLVGNTAMTHLLLDLPVRQLATAPFVAAASSAIDVRACDLDLEMASGAYVHVPPCIGGFVGADHVAMVLAGELDSHSGVVIGVDIGTNTEIALHKEGEPFLTSTSCASGPAFEGAHIHDGMRAGSGAIEAVHITPDGPEWRTIGGLAPVGLCGSGIVDVMAELHRVGAMNDRGRLQEGAAGIRSNDHGLEYLLVTAAETGVGRDIVVTQRDVNEVQLAKGAIAAGIGTLLESTQTAPEEVTRVVIAGAFGSYLNLDSTLSIGLLPNFPSAVYDQVGNAAGVGAKLILLSLKERQRAKHVARSTGYVELTTAPGFNRRFALAMLFPPVQRQTEATCLVPLC